MEDGSLTLPPSEERYCIRISQDSLPLVTILKDGTVVIHREGADKEAAKLFWESIQFEGVTLHQRIAALEYSETLLREELAKCSCSTLDG